MSKPSEILISAYLDGELEATERAQVERWLSENDDAQLLLRELQQQSEALRTFPKYSLDANFAERILADPRVASGPAASQVTLVSANDPSFDSKSDGRSGANQNVAGAVAAIASLAALILVTLILPQAWQMPLSESAARTAMDARAEAEMDDEAPSAEKSRAMGAEGGLEFKNEPSSAKAFTREKVLGRGANSLDELADESLNNFAEKKAERIQDQIEVAGTQMRSRAAQQEMFDRGRRNPPSGDIQAGSRVQSKSEQPSDLARKAGNSEPKSQQSLAFQQKNFTKNLKGLGESKNEGSNANASPFSKSEDSDIAAAEALQQNASPMDKSTDSRLETLDDGLANNVMAKKKQIDSKTSSEFFNREPALKKRMGEPLAAKPGAETMAQEIGGRPLEIELVEGGQKKMATLNAEDLANESVVQEKPTRTLELVEAQKIQELLKREQLQLQIGAIQILEIDSNPENPMTVESVVKVLLDNQIQPVGGPPSIDHTQYDLAAQNPEALKYKSEVSKDQSLWVTADSVKMAAVFQTLRQNGSVRTLVNQSFAQESFGLSLPGTGEVPELQSKFAQRFTAPVPMKLAEKAESDSGIGAGAGAGGMGGGGGGRSKANPAETIKEADSMQLAGRQTLEAQMAEAKKPGLRRVEPGKSNLGLPMETGDQVAVEQLANQVRNRAVRPNAVGDSFQKSQQLNRLQSMVNPNQPQQYLLIIRAPVLRQTAETAEGAKVQPALPAPASSVDK